MEPFKIRPATIATMETQDLIRTQYTYTYHIDHSIMP